MLRPRPRAALDILKEDERAQRLVAPDLRVEATPLMGHVLIQLPPGADGRNLRGPLDLPIPERPCTAIGDSPAVMWLGPRAWVVITQATEAAAALAAQTATALRGAGGHAVDLSDAHQSVRVSGAAAEALLAQGCMLDLEAAFPVGAATRTSLARMPVILHRSDEATYLLHVDRSIAHQLWAWLTLAVREIAALSALEPQRAAP